MKDPARWTASSTMLVIYFTVAGTCWADSAIDLLSGFDAARIEAAYPPLDDTSAGELSKLVYRLRSVDADVLQERVSKQIVLGLGDAVEVDGEILELKILEVPARLVEFLDLSQLQILVVKSGNIETRLVTTMLPGEAKPGDRVRGLGVAIEIDLRPNVAGSVVPPIAIAASRLSWFPKSPPSVGWRMLSEAGVDVSLLADIASRNRKPLLAEDGDAFYSMLAAAASLQQQESIPTPVSAEPVELLREPKDLVGHWLRMNLQTVQITRIAVPEPRRQAQLGSDHYYQIDAVGDLGRVVVQVERASGDEGPPATFESRYPVSVVIRDLPDFLTRRIRAGEGGDAVVAKVTSMIGIDAFSYRLWSYSTDFMNQHGGGEQFGPLLIASRIRDREPTSNDPAGVGIIGWVAAFFVLAGIIATWIWNRRVSARDREVREKRKTRESEQFQLP